MRKIILILVLQTCCAFSSNAAESRGGSYYYDYFSGPEKRKRAIVIKPAPIAGKCAFSFGDPEGDSFIVLSVSRGNEFIYAESGVWSLAVPLAKPLPKNWNNSGYEYTSLGKEWISVGKKNILAEKVLSMGGITGGTELWVHDKYGVVGYRPLTNPGKFILNKLPDRSLLSCK